MSNFQKFIFLAIMIILVIFSLIITSKLKKLIKNEENLTEEKMKKKAKKTISFSFAILIIMIILTIYLVKVYFG